MTQIKLGDIAELVGGELCGDPDILIKSVAKINEAEEGDISFIYQQKFEKQINETKASALIVKKNFSLDTNISLIKLEDPYAALIKIIEAYFLPEIELPPLVEPDKKVDFTYGKNFRCGKNVHIGKNCKIGDNVTIFSNSVLLNSVEVGDNTIIYPNVTIREYCRLGKRNIIYSGAVIGSDGFGYQRLPNKSLYKIPQIGIVVLEDDVEIGANTTVDRASMGETRIKRGTKIDNLVMIAHNCEIGEDCAISGQVGLSGSTTLGNRVTVAGQAGFAGHLKVDDDVIVLAQAGIDKDLKKGNIYLGAPARERKETLKLWATINQLPELINEFKTLKNEVETYKKILSNFIQDPEKNNTEGDQL